MQRQLRKDVQRISEDIESDPRKVPILLVSPTYSNVLSQNGFRDGPTYSTTDHHPGIAEPNSNFSYPRLSQSLLLSIAKKHAELSNDRALKQWGRWARTLQVTVQKLIQREMSFQESKFWSRLDSAQCLIGFHDGDLSKGNEPVPRRDVIIVLEKVETLLAFDFNHIFRLLDDSEAIMVPRLRPTLASLRNCHFATPH
jgi:hypothetical protein